MAGSFNYEKGRVEKLRALMAANRIDLTVIPPGPNFFYFSGLETEPMERLTIMLITDDEVSVVSPKMLEEQIEKHTWITDIRSWTDHDDPYRITGGILSDIKPSTIALDGALPYFQYYPLFQKTGHKTVPADSIISPLRMVKDEKEIEAISRAVSGSENALKQTLNQISEGMTEKEAAVVLEGNFLRNGLDRIAFPTIVASGENSSIPHHAPTERKIRKKEPIVIDFGGSFGGYASDTTRTVFLGGAPPKMEEIYNINLLAQETAISELSGDHTYADADRIAREVIHKKGYGDNFIHRLGHGLGISVHEDPYLVPTNTQNIGENVVFTIEPGIYLPGKGGVRIEDTTCFRHNKCTPFNRFTKELTIL